MERIKGPWRDQTATIALYDVRGRRIFAKRLGIQDRIVMKTPVLSAGLYFVTIGDQKSPLTVPLQ